MNQSIALILVVTLCAIGLGMPATAQGTPNAEKLGWKLGCQAYSFNRFTFFEAVDKNKSLGLKYIEMYPGQKLSAENPDMNTGYNMSAETQALIKAKLNESGVEVMNYGVVGLPNDEAECRKVFEFAKAMGIETIVSEPPEDAFDVIEKLCEEYKINVALHNHPKPSKYWNPEKVLEMTKGRSKRIGACADTGHWMRSRIDVLEALKMLEGRIISFHFKDLHGTGRRGADKQKPHDVPWGTGAGDPKAWLTEIKRQGIEAVFSIEYEHNWENSVPDIAQCVKYFDQVAKELSK